MKLEVGMYVRTRLGVGHILNVSQYDITVHFNNNDMVLPICETNIQKASHNIIDLIEVGDYVNGKPVAEIDEDFKMLLLDDNDKGWRTIVERDNIKTILTHEQFENNCYKVDD